MSALEEKYPRSEWQQLQVKWDPNEEHTDDNDEGSSRVSHWEVTSQQDGLSSPQLTYTLAQTEMTRIAAALSELAQSEIGKPFAVPVDTQVRIALVESYNQNTSPHMISLSCAKPNLKAQSYFQHAQTGICQCNMFLRAQAKQVFVSSVLYCIPPAFFTWDFRYSNCWYVYATIR